MRSRLNTRTRGVGFELLERKGMGGMGNQESPKKRLKKVQSSEEKNQFKKKKDKSIFGNWHGGSLKSAKFERGPAKKTSEEERNLMKNELILY